MTAITWLIIGFCAPLGVVNLGLFYLSRQKINLFAGLACAAAVALNLPWVLL